MGRRGPKAVELKALKGRAGEWTNFLLALRDGQPGLLEDVKWGAWEEGVPRLLRGPFLAELRLGREKAQYRTGQILAARRVSLEKMKEIGQKLEQLARRENYVFFRAVFPRRDLWEQLKGARFVPDVQRVARRIRKWERKFGAIVIWRELPPTIASHAREILRAKRLPNYPKSNRPSSDDKRVEFFAKALAGLMNGISPATAIKRLGGWSQLERLKTFPVPKIEKGEQQ